MGVSLTVLDAYAVVASIAGEPSGEEAEGVEVVALPDSRGRRPTEGESSGQ